MSTFTKQSYIEVQHLDVAVGSTQPFAPRVNNLQTRTAVSSVTEAADMRAPPHCEQLTSKAHVSALCGGCRPGPMFDASGE